jgi:hypothetical protein
MKFLVGGALRPEKPREEFVARVRHNPLSHQVWELVQKGVITEHGFKTGARSGLILVIECDSGDRASRRSRTLLSCEKGGSTSRSIR